MLYRKAFAGAANRSLVHQAFQHIQATPATVVEVRLSRMEARHLGRKHYAALVEQDIQSSDQHKPRARRFRRTVSLHIDVRKADWQVKSCAITRNGTLMSVVTESFNRPGAIVDLMLACALEDSFTIRRAPLKEAGLWLV